MRMSQEDAKRYVKEQIADYIVTEFGVQDIKKPFRCLNPAHEDRHPSMSLDREHNRVKCFSSSCGVSYDTLDLVALAHNIPPNDSRAIFQKAYEIFNLDVEGYSRDTDHQPVKEKNPDPDIESYLSECHSRVHETDYFQQRGLSEEVINRYRLGYDPHFTKNTGGKIWDAVIIPTGDSYTARNTNPNALKGDRYRKLAGKGSGIFHLQALYEQEFVFLVEGELDALSIVEANEQAIGLGSGENADKFLRHVEEHKPKAHIIILADNDEAGKKTEDKLHRGLERLNIPHTRIGLTKGYKDPNEFLMADKEKFLHDIHLFKMCGEVDAEEEETDTPPDEELDHLISIDDLKYKEADFLVEGLLERDSLVAVFGESGAGKSFFVIDLLASISAGVDFHGRPVQQAPCIYIAGEGKRGIIKRNQAWNIGRWGNPEGKKPFYPVRMGISLPDERMEEKLIDLIDSTIRENDLPTPGVIALDTLARTLSGDENSNADVSAYIRCLDRIKERYPGSTVVIVHHVGHGDQTRARGASALKCALDCEIRVQISADLATGRKTMTVSNSKAKDAEEFPDLFFSMNSVEVFTKANGEAETSLYLEEITADQTSRSKDKLPARANTALDSYKEALKEMIKAKVEADNIKDIHEGVHLDEWRTFFYRRSTAESSEAKRKAFERARADLTKLKILEVDSDRYKLTGEDHNKTVSAYFLAYKRESPGHMDRTGH